MFSAFLARTVVHTLDVFGMLESMPRGLLRFWREVYKLEPWGEREDWDRATMIAAAASNAGVVAANRMPEDRVKIYGDIETFLRKPTDKPKAQEQSPQQGQAILAAKFGPKA